MPSRRLHRVLLHVWAWMLDRPHPRVLNGQRCDRLRPARINRQLLDVLQRHGLGSCTLVAWQWDQRRERVEGWLWQRGVIQRFSWYRRIDELALWNQLLCTPTPALRTLA